MIDDEKERKIIINDIKHNYFVEASAGSGKTTSLVYRMVSMIEKGVPVDKICTITFTKAASDEFFSRFQDLLSKRSILDYIPDDEDTVPLLGEKTKDSVDKCIEALNNIDLCFMGTIDAFCNMIAHELPNELGVPSDSSIASNEQLEGYVTEYYDSILRNNEHSLYPLFNKFNNAFYNGKEAFLVGINKINDLRNIDIIFNKDTHKDINVLIDKDDKEELLKFTKLLIESDIKFYYSDFKKLYVYYSQIKKSYLKLSSLDWNECPGEVRSCLENIGKLKFNDPELVGGQLEDKGYLDITYKKAKDGEPRILKSAKLSKKSNDLLDRMLKVTNKYMYSLYFDCVTKALDDITEELKKKGIFRFYDFLYYTTEAFKKSSATDRKLVDHIRDRHQYFLIDESQDTNPMQTEMFFYLTGTVKTDDWTKTEPKEGSLFIVGDPKQSIYAFRGANVKAYQKTKGIFELKNEVLILRRNFRSNVSLKNWFNDIMDDLFKSTPNVGLTHEEIPITDLEIDKFDTPLLGDSDVNAEIIDGVYKYCLDDAKDDPEVIAKIITDLVGNKDKKIIVKAGKKETDGFKYRTVEYKDFLIVPFKTDVNKIVEAFDKYHIPFIVEAKIPFDKCEMLSVLIDLLLLLKCPSNRAYLIKILMSPLYCFEDDDLIKLANLGYNFNISEISLLNIQDKHIKDTISELNELFDNTKDFSYSSTLIYLLNNPSFNIFNRIEAKYLEYVYFFIEKIKTKEEEGRITGVDKLIDFIDSFLLCSDADKDNRVLRFKDKTNRVKISNLHKVKGLQAPIVILCSPSSMNRKVESYIDYSKEPPEAKFYSVSKPNPDKSPTKLVENPDIVSSDEMDIWETADIAEKDRLQYVGATRAESVLIVSYATGLASNYHNNWEKLYERIDDNNIYKIPDNISAPIVNPVKEDYLPLIEVSSEQGIKYHSPSSLKGEEKISAVNNNEDILNETRVSSDAPLIGTMVHKLIEYLLTSNISNIDKDLLINKISSNYSGDKYINILSDVYDSLLNGGYPQINSSLNKDIINYLKNKKQVMCEVPFSYRKGKVVISGIIDCVYLNEDDTWSIIDFKTNKENDVSILESHYINQLNDYKEALIEMGMNVKDAKIYHIDIDHDCLYNSD